MKFLNTNDKMSFVEIEDQSFEKHVIELTDEMMDLNFSQFRAEVVQQLKTKDFKKDVPTLIVFKVIDIEEDMVEYIKNFLFEVVAETISEDKVNNNWQPIIAITNKLDMTMKAQTQLLNYNTKPNILNVIFEKNEKILYNMIKEN